MLNKFIYEIGNNIVATFKGRNIFWHLLMIVSTYILAMSGFDWWFFSATRGNLANTLGLSAGMLGFFVPILTPLFLYLFGIVRQNDNLKTAGIKAFQAIAVAFIIIAIYKAFTGRIEPKFLASVALNDNSHAFNFGFWRHGIFWGWPSSHAGVAFALSIFLTFWYRYKKWVGVLAILYALYVAVGASITFHWFSDVFSGIIVGSLVGYTVYKSSNLKY